MHRRWLVYQPFPEDSLMKLLANENFPLQSEEIDFSNALTAIDKDTIRHRRYAP